MALPKLNNGPQYEMAIPSSGKSVRYRPFLVREQKALMLASESSDNKVMFRSVLDVLEQCVEDKIYQNQLTSFDVEYMFLQMRAKSVGESAEILIKCEECGADNPISINLEEIKVDVKNVDKKVQLTDDIALELNYPSYLDMINSGIGDGDLNADQMFEVMHSCVKYIETPDERIDIKDVDKKEVVEFIESMNSKQFEKIQEFISDIPRLSHTVKFDCKSCEHKNEITVEGISNFL
jgi:DNA-directed RNA polymerase subunit M/transcription elongation factor TFIIS